MRTRILVADDHSMVADGLGRIVADVADLLGAAHDGRELVEAATRLKPDVIVTDVEMPELSGIDAMRHLRMVGCTARFIFLTMHRSPELAAEALRLGASGYLLKEDAGEELLVAIKAVVGGRTYLTPRLTAHVLRQMAAPPDAVSTLSDRQRQVLRLVALGKRMKEIASELDISVRTVEGHKAQLMDRLGCESTADLVRIAIKQHIVPQ
ncbi:DNA-binding response regulator [Luteitalea sp. TBR-22]|uniref:response regulator n=1 Tax=Luteitalea sp. TBR-22 TaxID=2802971 RepID=UPI001AFB70C0|nr:response regulator transcription factor [Luteitalea sp. TBR-22]BCS32554.1 DNA-binding response regulator [Luteitalea sp. TBR-22]